MGERYRSALTQNDLISATTVSTIIGQYVKLGERKILAGELLTIGTGEATGQDNAAGRIFMDFQNSTPAAQDGTVRLSIYSPQNRPLAVLCEFRSETLRYGSTDRRLQVPLAINNNWISEDKKLVLEFLADASGVIDRTKTKINLDVTIEAV